MTILVGYTPASACTGSASPGARALMDWFLDTYPAGRNDGIYNCRPMRGGTLFSIHAEGRAVDLGTPLTGGPPAWGTDLARQLVDNSAELGVQCVIWDRRIWSGARPAEGWRPYGGVDPHDTHLHVELTRAAGRDLTVATISDVLAPAPPPKPAPAPRGPTDMAHTVSYAGTVWLIDAGTRRKVPDPDFLEPLRAAGIADVTDKVKDVKKYLGWWPYATAGDDQAAAILAAVTAAQAAGGTPEQIAKAVVAEIAS